jgi:hypothetical protein
MTETLPDAVWCDCISRLAFPVADLFKYLHYKGANMELGAFSISLAVKDIEASRAFYEKFGFTVFAGDASQH